MRNLDGRRLEEWSGCWSTEGLTEAVHITDDRYRWRKVIN